MSISSATMIDAAIRWPDMADTSVWAMAVSHAVFLWDHMPNPHTGLSPTDIFTRSRWKLSQLHNVHMSDGNKIPRWKPRSQRCINLGFAKVYASSVALVLNPNTRTITPQFHCVFDDWFSTITSDVNALPDFASASWYNMFDDSHYQYVLDEEDVTQLCELDQ